MSFFFFQFYVCSYEYEHLKFGMYVSVHICVQIDLNCQC